jgi:hypothetical protein
LTYAQVWHRIHGMKLDSMLVTLRQALPILRS